jgi:sugar phosphate isomerase/epimerase
MTQSRRSFLAALGAGAAGLAVGRDALAALVRDGYAPLPAKLDRIGIQVYTVRSLFSADPAGVIATLAKIGYKELEFAGYANKTPAEIAALLKANGLTAPSTHVGLATITPKLLDDAKIMGHQWVTAPSLPRGATATVDDWKKIADQFNTAGAQAKAAGLKFAFHNHNAEFRKIGDVVPLEVLIQNTDPALVDYEMDIHWVIAGGGDPIDLLTRYPTRFKMLHAKDSSGPPAYTQTDVGSGTTDFKKIFALAVKNGVKHVFVEADRPPVDPMTTATNSFNYLAKLEF